MIDCKTTIDLDDVESPDRIRARLRRKVAEIDGAIAEIRTQIATADMKRQARRGQLDPDWYHRARTALRHLQRERAELMALIDTLPRPKEALKDRIIEIVRADYDEDGWAAVLDQARAADGGRC